MSWRRRAAALALAAALANLALAARPSPPPARANLPCELAGGAAGALSGGVEAISGGTIGLGNPVGDACNKVSGALSGAISGPITDALKGVGNDVFKQITSWVAEGASWLIGQAARGIEATTTPKLTSAGFLAEYAQMAQIAALLAAAMLLAAVLEGLAQGNATLLLRTVLVNLPLALLATSVAYVVVQLGLVATDGLCHAIASASHDTNRRFFAGAIAALGRTGGAVGREVGGASAPGPTGGLAGEAGGTVAVPLFVTFLAAIVGAFAAFFVWLELLMRDAAVYVVALFAPLALAASVWPRWAGLLRRSAELLVALIGSKFAIVAIISLAAGLLASAGGAVEHILAAAALMLLACFSPFVLLRLVPFAEGAMAAAYGRRSASCGALSGVQVASDVQILRGMARSNWGGQGSGALLWEAGGAPPGSGPAGGGGGAPGGGTPGGGGGAAGGGGGAAGGGAAAGAGAAVAALPVAAARGAKGAAQRLGQSDLAQESGGSTGTQAQPDPPAAAGGEASAHAPGEGPPRPAPERAGGEAKRGSKA
jgi:hypothetical protein